MQVFCDRKCTQVIGSSLSQLSFGMCCHLKTTCASAQPRQSLSAEPASNTLFLTFWIPDYAHDFGNSVLVLQVQFHRFTCWASDSTMQQHWMLCCSLQTCHSDLCNHMPTVSLYILSAYVHTVYTQVATHRRLYTLRLWRAVNLILIITEKQPTKKPDTKVA